MQLDLSRRLTARDLLVRALGKQAGVVRVVDATAGLGRDAAGLASAGYEVLAVERAPALVALWREAKLPPRLTFVAGDARDVLRDLGDVHAVFIDPMYPSGPRKSAQKKAMVELREVVGERDDEDAAELLAVALGVAKNRVVVKRPKRAPAIVGPAGRAPDHVWEGSSTRYDAYFVKAAARAS